jgi:hypothetical protein
MRATGVPQQVGFATKPELGRQMLQRALDAGVPAAWVTADGVYGGNPSLRAWLETSALPYVLAVRCTEPLLAPGASGPLVSAEALAAQVLPECWLCNEIQRLFAALVGGPVGGAAHRLRWSWWRRRHQARARASHYRRQAARQP